ncbi:MAG: hypothetical protein ACU0A4_17355 [Paracoccaceae bacterium]|jgi:hypothetical protein
MTAPSAIPGIGHNREPAPVSLWHKHMWERARAAQPERNLPLAVVKMRMARAAELGMSYGHYATLYRTAGRDPAGLLFTPGALHLRLKRRLEMPDPVRAHLARLGHCHLLALAPEGEQPTDFLEELRDISALPFTAAAAMPSAGAPWPDLVGAVRAILDPLRLPGTAIALIGAATSEARLCASLVTAGRLGGVLDRDAYFRPAI